MTTIDWRLVVEVARAKFEKACRELPKGDEPVRVSVRVEAAERMPRRYEALLRDDIARTAVRYPHIRARVSVPLPVPSMANEDSPFHVDVRHDEDRPGLAPPVSQHLRARLTFTFGDWVLPHMLTPSPSWLPLRRSYGRYDTTEEIILPASLQVVPRKPLVELCLDTSSAAWIRRTAAAPGVTVLVDGREVPHPGPEPGVALDDSGVLSFVDGAERADIAFELTAWRDSPLTPAPGRRPGVGEGPFRTVINVGGAYGWLDIAPPEVSVPPRSGRFRVLAPRFEPGFLDIDADRLYTVGASSTSGLDDMHWHVKVYRTATPQQADLLRAHLAWQAGAVRRAVAGQGQRATAPPAGIASVYVLDPGEAGVLDAEFPPTRHGAQPPAADSPDLRYGEWFGVAATSDCFIVVAVPEMPPANTARAADEPMTIHVPRFRDMAAALDRLHGDDVAHCDIKPDNYRMYDDGYVLVDADSLTHTKSRPAHLPFTPPYARSAILRQAARGADPFDEADILDHDRFAFGLLVIDAVAGSEWLHQLLDGPPGRRLVDDPAAARAALRNRWSGTGDWSGLVDTLCEPLDENRLSAPEWTCAGWLDRVAAAANASYPVDVGTPEDAPPYAGPYARRYAAVRRSVRERGKPGRPERLATVHAAIEEQRLALARQMRLWWLIGTSGVGVIAFALFLAFLLRAAW